MAHHGQMAAKAEAAQRYYIKKNDILFAPRREEKTPLRNADNRIPSNFYGLLVNQKASYMFTAPPLFDVGSKEANDRILDILGDAFAKTCKSLCINASNAAVAWLHVWKDAEGGFHYGVVDARQIVPIWSRDLEKRLIALLRIYETLDEDGTGYIVYEYWTDTACQAYRRRMDDGLDGLMEYPVFRRFALDEGLCDESNQLTHGFGEVPFIPFFNNESLTSDLDSVKELIDVYDKVFSGFINDLEDIQEIIFVLSGYGDEDLKSFLENLKRYKAIKIDNDLDNTHPGVETLTINIPVEAREKMISLTRKAIFEQGQGIDPDPQNFGNSSGVALSYLYSLLELKAGLMETEFKLGFARFIRLLCRSLGLPITKITQTWTRTSVSNDAELADIAAKSMGVISQHTILKNHPWVEDPEKEETLLEKEDSLLEPRQEWDKSDEQP